MSRVFPSRNKRCIYIGLRILPWTVYHPQIIYYANYVLFYLITHLSTHLSTYIIKCLLDSPSIIVGQVV